MTSKVFILFQLIMIYDACLSNDVVNISCTTSSVSASVSSHKSLYTSYFVIQNIHYLEDYIHKMSLLNELSLTDTVIWVL